MTASDPRRRRRHEAGPDQGEGGFGPSPVTDEVGSERENELRSLIELMRPAVQADGGDLELVAFDVDSGTVEVQLQGACSSCAISSATLQGGVERILRSRLDWVTEVDGGVDESRRPLRERGPGPGRLRPQVPDVPAFRRRGRTPRSARSGRGARTGRGPCGRGR